MVLQGGIDESPTPLAAVVLAAGASMRMGSPKALLQWRGRPLVRHVVALAVAAGADPIVVVEGAHPLPDAAIAPGRRVVNESWRAGPLSSLQAGLRVVLLGHPSGVLVLTVDRPHVDVQTVLELGRGHLDDARAVWQPVFLGRHGHPIIWPVDLARRLLALAPGSTARTLLAEPDCAPRRRFVVVDDAAVVDNIDTPDDWARLRS